MSTDPTGTAPAQPPLQFEHAEIATAPAPVPTCSVCNSTIRSVYYAADGKVVCASCRNAIEKRQSGGSGGARFARALGLGLLGAIAGASIYYAVLALSGWNIGIIALVVGFLVGSAVRKGSEARGGWVYQTLAVGLTYFAIGATYSPLIVKEFIKQRHETEQSTLHSSAAPAKSMVAAAGTAADSDRVGRAASPARARAVRGGKRKMNPVVAAVLVVLAAIAFALLAGTAPLFSGDVIGIVIVGIALYEAWRLNKRVRVTFTGPHKVGALEPAGA